MKKLALTLAVMLMSGIVALQAKTASQIRVYINPGHGAWCSNCRPQNIIREVNGTLKTITTGSSTTTGIKPDTTAFYESNTNLWKCLAIVDKLEQYGLKIDRTKNRTNSNAYKVGAALDFSNNICMSRTKTGPYPIDNSNAVCNKALSTICAEANANNFDLFISVHSNANTDPSTANYLAIFYRGYSKTGGDKVSGSIAASQAAWPHLFSISHHKWTARKSSALGQGVIGDLSFYNTTSTTGYLGALKHNVPGYLAEGYFHTYRPARQRHMQRKVDVIEGYMYARGAADYFGLTKESTGDIYGVVRSTEKFNNSWYSASSSTPDIYTPLNGVTVVLKKNGAEVSRMTTDNHYNGAFVFTNLATGTYTVEMSKSGYQTTTSTVTVQAAKTACPELYMEPGQPNALKAAPLNNLTEKWNVSEKRGNATSKGYDATKIRNFCYNDGKLYCVYNHSEILVLNAQTGEKLGSLSNGSIVGAGTLSLCDVKAIDGKIIACNLAASATNQELRLYCWDNDNAEPQLLKTVSDLRGAARIGDCMELSGSFNGDMHITFANDDNTTTRLIDFYRLGGANWNGKAYSVTSDGSAQLKTSYTTRAIPKGNGWIIDGFANKPTYVTLNSSNVAVAQYSLETGMNWGSSAREFTWKGDKYISATTFKNPSSSAENYTGGRARFLVCNIDNYMSPITVADYPSDGLGDSKNTNTTIDSWVNTDGNNYVELWVNSTTQGICYYAYGNPPTHSVTPIEPNKPTISTSTSAISFKSFVGESESIQFTVKGSNLTQNISASISGANASLFSVNKSTINKDGQNTVEVTYQPTAAGTHNATLTLSSTGATSVSIALTGTASDPIFFDDEIKDVKEDWNFTTLAGTDSQADWVITEAGQNFTRDIQYLNGKLYAANNNASVTGCEVAIVNPSTGAKTGNLSVSGISGGRAILGGLSAIGGKLIASNSATSTQALKVYKWDSDSSAPELWFSDSEHAGITLGDQINTTGNMTNGRIWFSNANKVVYYTVTNGTVNTTANVITLSDNNTATINGSADVAVLPDGSFWVTGHQNAPKLYAADGTHLGTLNADLLGESTYKSRHQGTAVDVVDFGSRRYMLATTYVGTDNTIKNGALAIIDITATKNSVREMASTINGTRIGLYPENGMGEVRNTQFQTSLTYGLTKDDMKIEVFASIPFEGLVKVSYDGQKVSAVDNIRIDDAEDVEAPAEYYNLQGVRVFNPEAGHIYIVRKGAKVQKVLVR